MFNIIDNYVSKISEVFYMSFLGKALVFFFLVFLITTKTQRMWFHKLAKISKLIIKDFGEHENFKSWET